MKKCILLLLVCMPGVALAQPSKEEGSSWLQKIALAAHQLNYSGVFVYHHGGYMETSSIVHISDESGEHERLEVLDGAPREVIRNNDDAICFMPENKAVFVEKRKIKKSFPAILPRQLSGISENYAVNLAGVERVAGQECQNVILEPRDNYRYGHRFCADSASGLLLKVSTLNEKNEVVDQFSFTQVRIGGAIEREQLKSKFAMQRHVYVKEAPGIPADPGWLVKSLPSGFNKVMEQKRAFPGKKYPANHLVFSDGLAAISVFIEPLAGLEKPVSGLSRQGAINVYSRPVADHQVTVLGEVPVVTVMQIANSVAFAAK